MDVQPSKEQLIEFGSFERVLACLLDERRQGGHPYTWTIGICLHLTSYLITQLGAEAIGKELDLHLDELPDEGRFEKVTEAVLTQSSDAVTVAWAEKLFSSMTNLAAVTAFTGRQFLRIGKEKD